MAVDSRGGLLLEEFAQRVGVPDLAFDDAGFCSVAANSEVVDIHDDQASGHWLIFSDLGTPAAGEAIYLTLLQANLFWRATLGATLALTDDDPPHVVLALAVDWRSLDAARLEAIFDRFVRTLEDWRELIARPMDDDEHEVQATQAGISRHGVIRG